MKLYKKIITVLVAVLLISAYKTEAPSLYKEVFELKAIDGKSFNLKAF